MAEDAKPLVRGFRQATQQLMRPVPANVNRLGSAAGFEHLFANLNAMPNEVGFNPLDAATQQWPKLDYDSNVSISSDDVHESGAQAFYQRCMEAARNRHQSSLAPVTSIADKYSAAGASQMSTGKGKVNSPKRSLNAVASGVATSINNSMDSSKVTTDRKASVKSGGDLSSATSETQSTSRLPLVSSAPQNAIHDVSSLLVSSIAVIERYSNQVIEQKQVENTSDNDSRTTTKRETSTALNPSASVAKRSPQQTLMSAITRIDRLLGTQSILSPKSEQRASFTNLVSGEGKSVAKSGVALQPHTLGTKARLAHMLGEQGKAANGVNEAAAKPAIASRVATPVLDPDQLAEKVDQALREQAWLNGVDLS